MTPEKYEELHKAALKAQRAAYAAKKLLEKGEPVQKRADLSGWTPLQKLERQRAQSRENMRKIYAARYAAEREALAAAEQDAK